MQAIVLRWLCLLNTADFYVQVRIQRGAIAPLKTYESNLIQHDLFCTIQKTAFAIQVILSSTVLSQPCCEVYFISLTVVKPL